MNKRYINLTFKITSYNLLGSDGVTPNELNLTLTKKVNAEDNFLDVIKRVANRFKVNDKLNYYLEDIYRILWSEHFSESSLNVLLKNIDEHNYEALNVNVGYLNKQFNLQDKVIKILVLACECNYFMKFFFHINRDKEKLIPHVHCSCCGLERKIDLERLEFIEKSFSSRSLSCKALNIVHAYQTELMAYWETFLENEEELIKFKIVI